MDVRGSLFRPNGSSRSTTPRGQPGATAWFKQPPGRIVYEDADQIVHAAGNRLHRLASFGVRGIPTGEPTWAAGGRWLIVENTGPQRIQPGTVVVIAEGPKPVGYFHVEEAG